MKKPWLSLIAGLMTLFIGQASATTGFSEINNELFDKAHLKNVTVPGTLSYVYRKDSFLEGSREDTIDVDVTNIRNTGRADTHFRFFTGEHNRPYEDRPNQQGNGVFVLYLEYDISEMERLTSGDRRYFQRKIRWAFAEGADKQAVEIDYNGKKVPGYQYTIQPYLNDPQRSRFALYESKYYIFTLSEEIPGEIYQVRTIVPDGRTWREDEQALIDKSVTFVGFEPMAAQ